MNNHCAPQRPPHRPEPCDCVDRHQLEALYRKIEAKFATNRQVLNIIGDLKRLEAGTSLQATHVAQAAAAMVVKTIKDDMDELRRSCDRRFGVEVIPFTDKYGHPVVTTKVDYNKIYITPSDEAGTDEDPDNLWDEWIAIPAKSKGYNGRERYRWERIGSKRIDISVIKKDIKTLNDKLNEVCEKLGIAGTNLGQAIIDQAVKPLEELKAYVNSEEYIKFIWEKLPRANVGQDGLMPANSFALLSMLSIWAANDHKVLGGGALGPDVVIHMLEKQGVPCADLRKHFHHPDHCDDLCAYME